MKKLIFLLTIVFNAYGVDTLFVTYGSKPQNELIIRYIDTKKTGYFFLKNQEGEVVLQTSSTVALGKSYYLHRFIIGNLSPGQKVTFLAGIEKQAYTVSSLKEGPVSFCVTGDLYRRIKPYREGIKAMAQENPDFVIFGGDLAYTSHGPIHFPSREFAIKRYITFFKVIAEYLKKADGELVPIIAACGNHDYKKGYNEYVLDLFFPPYSKTYFHYDLGKQLDLLILDTGHVAPMTGLQQAFMKQVLQQSDKDFKIAVYHIGAYPSVYNYSSKSSQQVREAFCPIFDRYGVSFAFEHHSHAFKVTHPIKHDVINPEGTIYLGDGCLGVSPRKPKNKNAWFMQDAQAIRHYFKVSVDKTLVIEAKDLSMRPIYPVIEKAAQRQAMPAPQPQQNLSSQEDSETALQGS